MVFIKNRKAKHDYFVIEEFEAGLVLLGSEVKSIREGRVDLKGSWGYIRNGEVFINCSISKWGSSPFNHEETRPRKLLLHKKEIEKIKQELKAHDRKVKDFAKKIIDGVNRTKTALFAILDKIKGNDWDNAVKSKIEGKESQIEAYTESKEVKNEEIQETTLKAFVEEQEAKIHAHTPKLG